MRSRTPPSLQFRLAALAFAAAAAALGSFAYFAHATLRGEALKAFDDSLRANAEALATLVEHEEDTDTLELEFADEIMQRFSAPQAPDFFAVILPGGAVLEKSESLPSVPAWAAAGEEPLVRDFQHAGRPYRGIAYLVRAPAEAAQFAPGNRLTIFFASSRAGLDLRLRDSARALLISLLLAAAVIAAAIAGAVRIGLAPVHALAERTSRLGADSLGERFDPSALPRELRPLAEALNRALERIELAFRRERQFSADAAHELRTPVASLKAAVQAAQLGYRPGGDHSSLLADLLAEVERLESLCEALLDLSRAESSTASAAVIAAADFAAEARDTVARLARNTGRHVAIDFPEDAIRRAAPLDSDLLTVRRVTGNLVDNALRHTPGHVAVRVAIQTEPGGARLIVEDEGPGIPPETVPHLFERFHRVAPHRSRTSGGAGLGLAIARALARHQGGDLTYEPRTGGGCRFVWMIRAVQPPALRSTSA